MNRYILAIFILLFYSKTVVSQEQQPLISMEVHNQSLKEVLDALEKKVELRFFYAVDWLTGKTVTNASYVNQPIGTILEDLFKDMELNFFITADQRIILTRNNSIYNELPEGYFKEADSISNGDEEPDNENTFNPLLLKKQQTTSASNIQTYRIGKENRSSRNRRFKLSGRVTETNTSNPIANLALVVPSTSIGTVTNDNGYFQLELPAGLNVIETSALGLETSKKHVIIYSDGTLNFSLDDTYEELTEVVIDAEGVQNVEAAETGSSKIRSEDSKNIPLVLGERDVLKVATMLPGVTTAGEGATGFNVRGGKTDQNLILLDDAVIYNPSHFFGIFQALNPLAVREATIYKGSIPAEFGGRISSVFDISTKDASTEQVEAEVSIGPVTANAVVEIPVIKETSGLMLGGRAAYSDWVLRSLNESDFDNSQASFYDFIAKYNHKIDDKNTVRAMGYYSKDAFSITSDSLFSYNNRLMSLKWNHSFNDKTSGEVVLANSQYGFQIDYDDSINDSFLQSFQIDETEAKIQMTHKLNTAHQFNFGISSKLYSVLPGEIEPSGSDNLITPLAIPKERGLESGIFISDKFNVNDKLLLDLGLRYSFYAALGASTQLVYEDGVPKSESTVVDTLNYGKNEFVKTYGGPEIRFSARYLLSEDLSIKVSYNNAYQFIHTLSNNTTVSPVDTWKLSDTYIKPQRASQVSLGIYKNINVNAYEISLEGFYKHQNDILDFKTGAKLLLNEHIETETLQGKGKAYGAEFLLKKNKGDLNGWLGYTYSRSFFKLESAFEQEQVNGGEFFPSNYDKPHDFSLVLNYKITQRLSVSSNFVYQTGRPVTFPIGNYEFNGSEYVLYSDRNQFRIPDYYRLDVGFNIEGNHKKNKFAHSYWNISVYNVLNRNNPYSVFFVNEAGEVKAYQSSIFSVPVPSITYNIKF